MSQRTNTNPHTRQAPGRTLLILGFGTLAFVLAQTTVIPALGDLQRELGASPSGIAWMVTAYLLVASIATPIQVACTCFRIHASRVGIARGSDGGVSSRPWPACGNSTTVKSLPPVLRARPSVAALLSEGCERSWSP